MLRRLSSRKSSLCFPQIQHLESSDIECILGPEGNLGRGSFGAVRIGFHQRIGPVAVKCIEHGGGERSQSKFGKKIQKEIEILQQTNHENIVVVYGWTYWTNSVGIVMELMLGETLWDLLIDDDVELSMLLRLRMCTDIAKGLAFAHNLSGNKFVIHGDLKSENILLNEDLRCKIADFGSGKLSSYTHSSSTCSLRGPKEFTKLYTAPELLRNPTSSLKCFHDIYSFSIVVYEIMAKRRVAETDALVSIYLQKVMNEDKYRPDVTFLEEQTSRDEYGRVITELLVVMKHCWCANPAQRPPMSQVSQCLRSLLDQYDYATIMHEAAKALKALGIQKPSYGKQNLEPIHKFVGPDYDRLRFPRTPLRKSDAFRRSSRLRSVSLSSALSSLATSLSGTTTSPESPIFNYSFPDRISISNSGSKRMLVFDEWHNIVCEFDARKHSVETKKRLNEKHYGGTLVNYKGCCYVLNGFNSVTVERLQLDDSEAEWTRVTPTEQKRWQAGSTLCGEWIYTTGGYGGIGRVGKSSAERYSCLHDQWHPIKPMNKGRFGHALVSLQGSVYAVGGDCLNSVERYDPREGTWSEVAPMRNRRGGVAAVVLDGKIYAIGGCTENKDLDSVEMYDLYANRWQAVCGLNKKRRFHGACVVRKSIYVAGGAKGGCLLGDVEVYIARDNYWRSEATVEEFKGGLKMVVL